MALFLESVEQTEVDTSTLEEKLQEGVELAMEFAELNEAILVADFTLHERNRSLSEDVRLLKEENFFSKAWETLKKWLKKAWAWIKATANKYWEAVKSIYARIKDRIKGDTVTRSKAVVASLEFYVSSTPKILAVAEHMGGQDSLEAIEADVVKLKALSDASTKKLAEIKKLTGTTTVSITYAAKLEKLVADTAKTAAKVIASLEKQVAKLDKDLAAGKTGKLQGPEGARKGAQALRIATTALSNTTNKALSGALKAIKALASSKAVAVAANP